MRSLSSRLFMICHVWERVLFVLIFWLFHHIFQSMNFVNTFNVLGLPNWMLVQMNIRKIIIIITRNNQTAYSPWSIFNYLFILFFANNFFRAIETQSMAWETDSIANERQCTFKSYDSFLCAQKYFKCVLLFVVRCNYRSLWPKWHWITELNARSDVH